MNSVGRRKGTFTENDDFFTNISFSALMGELSDKENIAMNLPELIPPQHQRIRIKCEVERIWNAKENQQFINKIFQ
jgi:hypothetical protein